MIGILVVLPTVAFAATHNSRIQGSDGKPRVMEDATSSCSSASKIRYDGLLGMPSPILDATATCEGEEPPAAAPSTAQDVFWFD